MSYLALLIPQPSLALGAAKMIERVIQLGSCADKQEYTDTQGKDHCDNYHNKRGFLCNLRRPIDPRMLPRD
jgi:hypothetical protein